MNSSNMKSVHGIGALDLQEKRILLYIDLVLGLKFVIVQNLTSEMTEAGG